MAKRRTTPETRAAGTMRTSRAAIHDMSDDDLEAANRRLMDEIARLRAMQREIGAEQTRRAEGG